MPMSIQRPNGFSSEYNEDSKVNAEENSAKEDSCVSVREDTTTVRTMNPRDDSTPNTEEVSVVNLVDLAVIHEKDLAVKPKRIQQ